MASSPDYEDTQVVDSPPPSPPEDTFRFYGETQVLEEDDEVVRGVEEWIETQAVDHLEETQVAIFEKRGVNLAGSDVPAVGGEVGVEEAVFERKEENLANTGDEETQVLHGWSGGGDEETQVLVEDGVGEAIFEEKGENLADPDAFLDGGIGGGATVQNDMEFWNGAVRTMKCNLCYWRSELAGGSCKSNSGLAAARSIASKAIYVEPKSPLSNSENCESQDNGGDGKLASGEMETRSNLTDRGTRAGEAGKELDIEDPHECMQDYDRDEKKSKMGNSRARKLLYEHKTTFDDDTTINPNKVCGKVDSPCSLVPDPVVAGLNYIGSQEPGDLSQANALDIVDKLISVNDLGLSQETNTGKTDLVKSRPISSTKGARSLAKKFDRSPLGKEGTFEWIDSQEDEGGGEFFARRKESFFDCKVAERKSRSQPPKSKKVSFDLAKEAADKTEKRHFNIQNQKKASSLACSDSRVTLRSSFRNEKVNASKTKTKKNLFKDLNEQSNSVNVEQQLEVTDFGRDGEVTYEVGPDTQMAAEAMEALVHGSPINYEINDVHAVAENSSTIGSEDAAMKNTSSKRTSLRNSTSSTPNIEGVSTRSKRRRIVLTQSSIRRPRFSRSKSEKGKSLDCTTVKSKEGKENKRLERHLNERSIVNKIESSVSLKGGKATSPVNGDINKEADSFHISPIMNVQLSVSKEHASCEFHVSSTPVAHRTRHSEAVKLSKQNEALANSGRNTSGSTGVRTRRAISREDKLTADASGSLKMKRKAISREAKLEASPKEVLQPYGGLTCTTPLKDIDAVSPVCVTEGCPRAFDNKRRSRSLIARELIRLENCEASPTSMFSTRQRKDIASVRILFSHHLDGDIIKQQKKIMGRLGVALASSISDATHFVTDKFVRTRNMLEAMSMGKSVVTHMWLESCGQTSFFIDEKNYILRDAKKEKEIGFSMPVSLARACQSPLLQDKRIYITPNTKPDRELLSSLVKAGHGQPVERIGRSTLKDDKLPDDLLVLSCEEDYELCVPLLEKGAEIFSSELLLNGIVIQKLEYERHGLFSDHVKRTRLTLWLRRRKDGGYFLPATRLT